MVSIVVPVYNGADTVGRCIESLLSQTYNDYEIVIVDDGSIDKSLEICQKYGDAKVSVFSKSNGGPASARNFGIDHCSPDSEFVMFVDCDDIVDKSYISEMVSRASQNTLVMCGIADYYGDSTPSKQKKLTHACEVYEDIWMNSKFLSLLRLGIINSSCNKCYYLSLIRKYNIRFEQVYPEDTRFNLSYLDYCDKICVLADKLYNYIHRSGSITSQPTETIFIEYSKIQSQLLLKVDKENYPNIYEFTYPQYVGTALRYIKKGDFHTPKKYLSLKPIKDAIRRHKSTGIGDAVLKYLFLIGCYRILKHFS